MRITSTGGETARRSHGEVLENRPIPCYASDRMRMSRKTSRIIWIGISIVGIISMIAFTILPILYSR